MLEYWAFCNTLLREHNHFRVLTLQEALRLLLPVSEGQHSSLFGLSRRQASVPVTTLYGVDYEYGYIATHSFCS